MLLALAVIGALAGSPAGASQDTLSAAARLRPASTSLLSWEADATAWQPAHGAGAAAPSVGEGVVRAPTGGEGSVEGPGDAAPEIIEYSDAYFTRLTIHRWASYLTLPLFVGQYVVGQKLMNGDGSVRNLHGALAGGVAGLFAVNTVTGGWNAIEAWKDPEGRNRRTLHTALMLLADAGFAITGALAHENEGGGGGVSNNTSHRNMAIASMGVALVGYSVMLPIFGIGDMGALIDVVAAAAAPWSDFYSDSAATELAVMFLHLGGVVAGGGLAFSLDRAVFRAGRADEPGREAVVSDLNHAHGAVLVGLAAVIVSGVMLTLADPTVFLPSWVFWAKMAAVALLLVNGLFLKKAGERLGADPGDQASWRALRSSALRSAALWTVALLAGVAITLYA